MIRAFKSEWIKLSRRTTLLGFGGAMVGFAALLTVLVFLSAGGTEVMEEGRGPASFATVAALSVTDGSIVAFTHSATFLGIIALALFASNLAGEFGKGTIRMLFVTEPRRLRVLWGKLAALGSFVAGWLAVALGVSVGIGALLGPNQGVETAAWFTADGLGVILGAYLNMTLAVLVVGLIGALLATLSRSAALAISAGAAYILIVEPLVGAFWETISNWGPAAAFSAFAEGGSTAIAYATAGVLLAVYGGLSLAASSTILSRRDVTS